MSQLKVAVCQLTSTDDLSANLRQIQGLLQQLEEAPPDLVCFPENALFLRLREGASIPAIDLKSSVFAELSAWSVRHKAAIHLGSVPVQSQNRLFNTSVLLTPDGQVDGEYRKIHLFDVDVEGHKPVRESDVFSGGTEPHIFNLKGWRIGSTICYDLRFSELFLYYAKKEVDVILIPSAFLVPTGRAHWNVLVRARAIESQVYVLAAAQGGQHLAGGAKRETYGHSMIVDPWGVVLAEIPEVFGEQRILRATLERERVEKVRAQIPVGRHRRL